MLPRLLRALSRRHRKDPGLSGSAFHFYRKESRRSPLQFLFSSGSRLYTRNTSTPDLRGIDAPFDGAFTARGAERKTGKTLTRSVSNIQKSSLLCLWRGVDTACRSYLRPQNSLLYTRNASKTDPRNLLRSLVGYLPRRFAFPREGRKGEPVRRYWPFALVRGSSEEPSCIYRILC